jgi:hypothetical protein
MSKYTYRQRVGGAIWRSDNYSWQMYGWTYIGNSIYFKHDRFIDVPDTYIRLVGGTLE